MADRRGGGRTLTVALLAAALVLISTLLWRGAPVHASMDANSQVGNEAGSSGLLP